ncbi:MAG TPA: TetR/AcrR family transcriptional regulator [Acidimicrobiales bacterium]|nr:TetR/AcrR family transcriptional regulator [Acidimicrobiales bacterium]
MTTTTHQRRQPVQERSRETVARLLDAAAAIIDEAGVEAATTRAIAERDGVAYPSLYRFYADREEILEQLLERHLADLDAEAVAAEETWQITSIEDVIDRELDLHIAYYEEHPSAARLWLSGRSSPTVIAHVRERTRVLAERMRSALIGAGLISPETDSRVLLLVVELGDRILDVAFRGSSTHDPVIIQLGRTALKAYALEALDSAAH